MLRLFSVLTVPVHCDKCARARLLHSSCPRICPPSGVEKLWSLISPANGNSSHSVRQSESVFAAGSCVTLANVRRTGDPKARVSADFHTETKPKLQLHYLFTFHKKTLALNPAGNKVKAIHFQRKHTLRS